MKLRIQGNALRLRLNQAEVAQFSKTGCYEDSVEFSPGVCLTYALESSSSIRCSKGDLSRWVVTDSSAIPGWVRVGHYG